MSNLYRAKIVPVGNSRGVRLPKLWLDQLNLGAAVEMEMGANQIVIRPALSPRQGWEEQFAAMGKVGDDRLLDEPRATAFDKDEWQW